MPSSEFIHWIWKGLRKERSERFASVAEMHAELEEIIAGRFPVSCHITLSKRVGRGMLAWIDRHPLAFTLAFLVGVGSAGFGLFALIGAAMRSH